MYLPFYMVSIMPSPPIFHLLGFQEMGLYWVQANLKHVDAYW